MDTCCSVPRPPKPAAPVPQSKAEAGRLDRLREMLPPPFTVHTSLVFNPITLEFDEDLSLRIDPATGLITKIIKNSKDIIKVEKGDIDLRGKIVLPGFVDAHTHIFLHSYDEADIAKQTRDESFVERILRATNHCVSALLAGYTTYRDLGSEGMEDADANFRDAINRGIIVGPRLFVATKVLASVAGVMTHTENKIGGTRIPDTSEACDGEVEIRKAVRRRLGMGCDVVKFFADYRKRVMRFPPATPHPYLSSVMFPPDIPNPDVVLYTQEEVNVLCEEAKNADCPVAAHCATNRAVQMAAKAGVNTLEHCYWCDLETLAIVKENNCIMVPTLTIAENLFGTNFQAILKKTYNAWRMGINQACGGDTGTFNHGQNIREAELFIEAGIPLTHTLRSLTFNGWLACGGHSCGRKFGWIGEGCAADIVALNRDPREDLTALRDISFVMKDGRVYKKEGKKTF